MVRFREASVSVGKEQCFVGGGTFFNGVVNVGASWPLLQLRLDDGGVTMGLRWRRRARASAGSGKTLPWEAVRAVEISRRSVSWRDAEGFFYRFVSIVDGAMDEVADEFDARGIEYRIVRGTWWRPVRVE
jgi:hypothetical protein